MSAESWDRSHPVTEPLSVFPSVTLSKDTPNLLPQDVQSDSPEDSGVRLNRPHADSPSSVCQLGSDGHDTYLPVTSLLGLGFLTPCLQDS